MRRAGRIGWIVTIVYWCGLFLLTHLPARRLPVVPVTDKTAHFVCYGILATALFISLRFSSARQATDVALIVLAVMLAYGAIDEWTQIPVGRSCEMADWYADAAGAATAVTLAGIISRWVR